MSKRTPKEEPGGSLTIRVPADLAAKAREIRDGSPELPELRPELSTILVAALRRGLQSKALARE